MDNNIIVDFKKQLTKTFLAWKSYVLQVTKCPDKCDNANCHDVLVF